MERRKYNQKIQDKQKRLINKLMYLHSNYLLDQFNVNNANLYPKHLQIKHNTKPKANSLNQHNRHHQLFKSDTIQLMNTKQQCMVVLKKELLERVKSKKNNIQKNINQNEQNQYQMLKAFRCCKVKNFCSNTAFGRITKPQIIKASDKNPMSESTGYKSNSQLLIPTKKAIVRPCSTRKSENIPVVRPWISFKKRQDRKIFQPHKQNYFHINPPQKPTPLPLTLDINDFNPWEVQSIQNSQL